MSAELQFHPLADIFPLMEGEEFDALVADIKANGLREQIVLYEGKVLDGRNRYRALRALGVSPVDIPGHPLGSFCGRDVLPARDPGRDPAGFVVSRNIHRRHLTAEQKHDLIAKLLKAQPEKSNRQIAATVKASPTTVGTVRAKMEKAGDVSKLDTRVDSKGRKQPAKKRERPPHGKETPELQRAVAAPAKLIKAQRALQTPEDSAPSIIDGLREKLRAAEIKIVGLEAEIEDLKRENADLLAQLEAAKAVEPLAGHDPGPIPDFLRREPKGAAS
jgi:DNA-binding Lrp family transcriptional regulator